VGSSLMTLMARGGGGASGGELIGMGSGGDLPRRRCQSVAMAWSLLGGDSCTPVMAAVRARVAAMMRLVGVIKGTSIVWCLKRNVLVRHSPLVPYIMARMQR
jgi:hypothetical protein